MADVLQEYLVSLGFDVQDETGWSQALQRAGQRVRTFHDLQNEYGRLGVQVAREAVRERESIERALQRTVEGGLRERERLGTAVERALARAVRLGHQERQRVAAEAERALSRTVAAGERQRRQEIRETERAHVRSEIEKERATQRAHAVMSRAVLALTATSSAAFYAIKKSTDELTRLHDISDRTGASVGSIRALEDAYKKVGLSAADAASDVENLAGKTRTDMASRSLQQSFGINVNTDAVDRQFQIAERLRAQFGNQGPAGYMVAANLAQQMGIREQTFERLWNRPDEMRAEMARSREVRTDQNKRSDEAKDLSNSIAGLWRKASEQLEAMVSDSGALPRFARVLDEISGSKIPYASAMFVAAGAAVGLLASVASFAAIRLGARALLGGSILGSAGRVSAGAAAAAAAGTSAGAGVLGTVLRGLGFGAAAGGAAMAGGALLEKVIPSQRHDDLAKEVDRLNKRPRTKSFLDMLYGPGGIDLGGAAQASTRADEPPPSAVKPLLERDAASVPLPPPRPIEGDKKVEVALTEEDVQRLERGMMPGVSETNRTLQKIESFAKETVEAIKDLGKKAENKGLYEALFGKGVTGPGGVGMGGAGGIPGVSGGGGIDTGGAGGASGSSVISGRASASRAASGSLRDRIAVAKAAAIEQLRKEGVPEGNLQEAANLLTGQAIHESKLNPTAKHDPSGGAYTGFGIYGARNPPGRRGRQRATEMINWIKQQGGDPNDLSWQMREMAHRAASGDYPQTRQALMSADPSRRREQMFALTREFENPAVKGDRSASAAMAAGVGANADAMRMARQINLGPGTGATGNLPGMGADRRLMEILNSAQRFLPEGYSLRQTSGLRHGHRGQHPKGMAADLEIVDPQGRAVRNRGEDVTGLYTKFAAAVAAEQRRLHPELTGRLAWGGAFGTSARNPNEKDLMHFDLGGERGRFRENHPSSLLARFGASAQAAEAKPPRNFDPERVEALRSPAAPIAPAPSSTTNDNKKITISQDNDINLSIHGSADADMIAAGVTRKQRVLNEGLLRDLQGSVR